MPRGAARFILALLLLASGVSAQQPAAKPQYSLAPTPKTIAWGYYDASTPPVLRVKSGDTVEVQMGVEAMEVVGRDDLGIDTESAEHRDIGA